MKLFSLKKDNFLINNLYDFPNKIDVSVLPANFRWQSFTSTGKYIVVSCYAKDKKNLSRLYLYDKSGCNLGYILLDNNAHVGGVTFDNKRDILFVTGKKGKINAYNFKAILNSIQEFKCGEELISIDSKFYYYSERSGFLDINNDLDSSVTLSAATICFNKDRLFVATFSCNSQIFEYILEDGRFKFNRKFTDNLIPAIQGIAIYNNYLIVSQSFGYKDSCIVKYKILDDNLEFVGQKVLRHEAGLEGLTVTGDVVFGNFENVFHRRDRGSKIIGIKISSIDGEKNDNRFIACQKYYMSVTKKII